MSRSGCLTSVCVVQGLLYWEHVYRYRETVMQEKGEDTKNADAKPAQG